MTAVISLFVLLGLIGVSGWLGRGRVPEPAAQPAAQPAQGVPLDSPLAVVVTPLPTSFPPMATDSESSPPVVLVTPFIGTPPIVPTFEPSPQPTFDYDSVVYEPTATLTQKEEVIFDPTHGITMTLQPGLFVRLTSPEHSEDVYISNFQLREDIRQDPPINWISAKIGSGQIPDQESFKHFAAARRQYELDSAKNSGGSTYEYGELEPFELSPYHGYAFTLAGPNDDLPPSKDQLIYLQIENRRFVWIMIWNTDSRNLSKIMQSLSTMVFAPMAFPTATALPTSTIGETPMPQPIATLTQKEEVIFDPVNGITMTLQPGFVGMTPLKDSIGALTVSNYDLGRDPRLTRPDDYIDASIGVNVIPNGQSIETIATRQRQGQVEYALSEKSDYEYSELEPIDLGQYHGYSYVFSGTTMNALPRNPLRSQVIFLSVRDMRYGEILVNHIDSSDWNQLLKSLGTLEFAPASTP